MSLMMEGKTIVVAGVGTGLGSQVGRLGLREGANIVLAARSDDTLQEIASELDPSGDRVLTVQTDITDEAQCERLAAEATKRFGGIDAICQVAARDRFFGGLGEVTREEWMAAFPDFELADPDTVTWSTGQVRGPRQLPIRFPA